MLFQAVKTWQASLLLLLYSLNYQPRQKLLIFLLALLFILEGSELFIVPEINFLSKQIEVGTPLLESPKELRARVILYKGIGSHDRCGCEYLDVLSLFSQSGGFRNNPKSWEFETSRELKGLE